LNDIAVLLYMSTEVLFALSHWSVKSEYCVRRLSCWQRAGDHHKACVTWLLYWCSHQLWTKD